MHTKPAPTTLPTLVAIPIDADPATEFAGAALNADAELLAIKQLRAELANKRKVHPATQEAMLSAYLRATEHGRRMYALACQFGGLLFAWHGTAAFESKGGAL